MKRAWIYLINPFLVVTADSYRKAKQLGDYTHIAVRFTVVLTVVLFFSSCFSPKEKNAGSVTDEANNNLYQIALLQSGTITKNWADTLRSRYVRDSTYQLKTFDSISKRREPLQGFTFDFKSLDTIMNHNASGITPDKVIFYLGEDTGNVVPRKWHIIAYGVKGDTLLQTSTTANRQQASIMDKAVPCPPTCPTK